MPGTMRFDSDELRRRLGEAFGPARRDVCIGLRTPAATIHVGGEDRPAGRVARTPLRTGCLTKLLTADMTRAAAADGRFDLADDFADVLGIAPPRIVGVTIRHLLEHTHGLDGSRLERAPSLHNGRLDARRLHAAALGARPLARPGRLYNYGDIGPWLAAAVLERATGRPYAALLTQWLQRAPGAYPPQDAAAVRAGSWCPSTGASLRLPHATVLDALTHGAFGPAALGLGSVAPLPGFSPLERGVCLGWKHYGASWLGHHSIWPGAEALVRVNVAERVGILISSRGVPVLAVAARVLGRGLPELAALRVPRPLAQAPGPRFDAGACSGTYATAAETIVIAAHGRELRLEARLRGADGRIARAARLQPAEHDVLLTVPVLPRLPFVQLVRVPGERDAYLWNGRQAWPRVRAEGSAA